MMSVQQCAINTTRAIAATTRKYNTWYIPGIEYRPSYPKKAELKNTGGLGWISYLRKGVFHTTTSVVVIAP